MRERTEARGEGQKSERATVSPPAPPSLRDFFPGKLEKMSPAEKPQQQLFDFIRENEPEPPKTPEIEPFFTAVPRKAECMICGAIFELPPRSSGKTCSADCRRQRQLNYGAAYRQQGREARQKLHDMFGGRRPTGEELLQLHRARKGQP